MRSPKQRTARQAENRRARLIARGSLGLVICILAGWSALSGARHLEADNAFCISCHDNGQPMHQSQYQQLTRGSGGTLAAAHQGSVRINGERRQMRCIDCHRGADRAEQMRLDWLALKDLGVQLSGQGHEPSRASFIISDAVCQDCHGRIIDGVFHRIQAHRGRLNVGCVDCHQAHHPGAGPVATDPSHNKRQCANCHSGLAAKVIAVAEGRQGPS